jgi:hypothetical protein
MVEKDKFEGQYLTDNWISRFQSNSVVWGKFQNGVKGVIIDSKAKDQWKDWLTETQYIPRVLMVHRDLWKDFFEDQSLFTCQGWRQTSCALVLEDQRESASIWLAIDKLVTEELGIPDDTYSGKRKSMPPSTIINIIF